MEQLLLTRTNELSVANVDWSKLSPGDKLQSMQQSMQTIQPKVVLECGSLFDENTRALLLAANMLPEAPVAILQSKELPNNDTLASLKVLGYNPEKLWFTENLDTITQKQFSVNLMFFSSCSKLGSNIFEQLKTCWDTLEPAATVIGTDFGWEKVRNAVNAFAAEIGCPIGLQSDKQGWVLRKRCPPKTM